MRSGLPRWWPRDRRQAQAGATLVELLVAVTIMGLALALIIGTFSTGLVDSVLAKRNTAGSAVVQYELEQISAGGASTPPYSDCFATENATTPTRAINGSCGSAYALRVDMAMAPGPNNTQIWSITVISLSNSAQVGKTVQTIRGTW